MSTQEALLSIPPSSAAIRTARRFTAAFLRENELAELIDTVVLLVSEVVTNAIIHGGTGAELRLIVSGEAVRAEVRDRSSALPSVKQYSETATTGRGMLVVDSLATAWGTEVEGRGKLVWFSVDVASYIDEPMVPERSALNVPSAEHVDKGKPARPAVSEDMKDGAQKAMVLAGVRR